MPSEEVVRPEAILSRALTAFADLDAKDGGPQADGGPKADARGCTDARAWVENHVPLLDCPDAAIQTSYYFRWWTYRKHIRKTDLGYIVTEFLPEVPWAGYANSIVAAAGHHLYEGRWLRGSRDFLADYVSFWFRKEADSFRYRTWLADAVRAYACVTGDLETVRQVLPALIDRQRKLQGLHAHSSGLYWSDDDHDAMEYSISGNGLRPTLNSYLFGDARAIAEMASWLGEAGIARDLEAEAERLRALVLRLWQKPASFFKTVHAETQDSDVGLLPDAVAKAHDARELIGFIPWYFGLPPDEEEYGAAWSQLLDEDGFQAPFGLATAERRHPRFMFKADHEC
ncbi:MAG TPA: hypothetical protein VFH83_06775, partial [Spirochaetia bacterium]|nr:hypothetical protein [Spirochaetia bacterium]